MLAGQPVPVPSPEDELLIAGLHAHHHNFGILRALMDVAEYAKRFGRRLDWPKLVALAKGHRCWGRVSAALMLADAALGLDEPPVSLPLSRRQRWAVRGLSAPAVLDTTGEQDDWRRLRLGMLMDRWRDVLRQVGPHFWPPRSYLQALCPRPWGRLPAAARAYHLARLFGKGMHFLLRRVRRLRLSTPVPHRG
jgi:hypothetical protein